MPDDMVDRLLNLAREESNDPEELTHIDSGRYRVIGEVGRGGMGIVFKAEDKQLGRIVALKVLRTDATWDSQVSQRFAREALAAARLEHPNIAAIYDASPEFISMRWVEGPSLAEWDERDPKVVAQVMRVAAEAVHYAHRRGIIHRDLKPANLMIEPTRDDPDGMGGPRSSNDPKLFVMDFGLAKELSVDSSLSVSGNVLGTPAFMPPEQALGRHHEVDEQSDVYGLGATLYALLAEAPPFPPDPDSRSPLSILQKVVEDEPRKLRDHRPDLDVDLETIVVKAMAKDRGMRYATAAEFAADLGRWLNSEPIQARRPSVLYQIRKLARRRASAVRAVAVAVVVMSLAAGGLWLSERVERSGAEAALRLSSTISALVQDADDAFVAGDVAVRDEKLRQATVACRDFVDRHEAAAAGHYLLGSLLMKQKLLGDALVALDRSLELDPALDEARFLRGLALLEDSARKSREGGGASLIAGHLLDQAREDLKIHERSSLAFRRVDVLYGEARLALLDGDLETARANLRSIVYRLDPLHVEAQRCLADLIHDEDPDESVRLASRSVDLEAGRGPKERYLGAGVSRGEEVVGAGALFPPGIGASADFVAGLTSIRDAKAHRLAGDVDSALSSWRSAIRSYDQALVTSPGDAGVLNNRGVARVEVEKLQSSLGHALAAMTARMLALRDFDAAVEGASDSAIPRINRAEALRRLASSQILGGLDEEAAEARDRAEADYRRALELVDPVSPLRDWIDAALSTLASERP